MLKFDLSALPPHVTLLSAALRAVVINTTNINDIDIYNGATGTMSVVKQMTASAYPLTVPWTDNGTWQTSDGTTPWATPGGDYDPSAGVSAVADYSRGTYGDATTTWNITSIVRRWYLGGQNDGLIVRMDDEQTPSSRGFDYTDPAFPSDQTGAGLQVLYSYIPWQGGAAPGGARAFDPHAALKSDRSLVTFPQGDGQQLGANVANGDLEIMRNDVSLPSVDVPNVVQRTFHSTAAITATTSLGHLWQLSVGGDTALYPQPTGDAIYMDPTGQGYDLPSAVSNTVSAVVTDTATQGNWTGGYGHDGYILNGWSNGADATALPGYAGSYRRTPGAITVWQTNTADPRALAAPPGQTGRNAAALTASTAPTQTQQVVTFTAQKLITASVYLLNWGAAPTSITETVGMRDAVGSHSYQASNFGAGLWVRFTNLRVGPTQPLTVTVAGDGPSGSSALSSALTFDGSAPAGYARAQGLPADLVQQPTAATRSPSTAA